MMLKGSQGISAVEIHGMSGKRTFTDGDLCNTLAGEPPPVHSSCVHMKLNIYYALILFDATMHGIPRVMST